MWYINEVDDALNNEIKSQLNLNIRIVTKFEATVINSGLNQSKLA